MVCYSRGSLATAEPHDPGYNGGNKSSVRLGPGVARVVFFELRQWRGMQTVLDADVPNLDEGFHGKANSVEVIPRVRPGCVMIFAGTHYRGWRTLVCENERYVGRDWNDAISSMVVPRNTFVLVHAHMNYTGRRLPFGSNKPDLIFYDMDNAISSISFISFESFLVYQQMRVRSTFVRMF